MTYADMEGDTLAVCGKIRHYDEMPEAVAAFLKADKGSAAGYYIIQREIPRLGLQGGSEYLRTVVYVPSAKHGRTLMSLHEQSIEATVFVRLVVREARAGWPGFPTFDEGAKFRPFALVSTWVTQRGELPEHDIDARRK